MNDGEVFLRSAGPDEASRCSRHAGGNQEAFSLTFAGKDLGFKAPRPTDVWTLETSGRVGGLGAGTPPTPPSGAC